MATSARAFSLRLQEACDRNPRIPPGHGRMSDVRQRLEDAGAPVTLQAVSNWFGGRTVPRPHQLQKLAKVLGVSEAWLLGLETNAGQPSTVEPETYSLPVPLRPGLTVTISSLPFDLTESEAKRLSDIVTAMVRKAQ